MKALTEIYAINGQDPGLAFKSGQLEFDDRFACLVWTPAEFVDDRLKTAEKAPEPQGSECQKQNARPVEKGQNTRKQTQSGIKRQLVDLTEFLATEFKVSAWNV